MTRMPSACGLAAALLAASAAAQTVYTVDRLNRPGTHFTDLPAAEAAARDGDVLRLRADAGSYTGIVTQKALTIVADLGQAVIQAPAGQSFAIRGIGPGKQFTLRGALIGPTNLRGPVLQISNCAGRVVLHQVETFLGRPSVEITACAGVSIQESRLLGGFPTLSGRSSHLALAANQMNGGAAHDPSQQQAGMAIELRQCTAEVSGCQIFGGIGHWNQPPAPAALFENSSVRAGAPRAVGYFTGGAPGLLGTGSASAIVGTSSLLRATPAVSLRPSGSAPATQGITVVRGDFPAVISHSWQFRPLQDLIYETGPGSVNITVSGLAFGPYPVPGVAGLSWLDPVYHVAQPGTPAFLDATGLPLGHTLVTQVVGISSAGAVELSNPTFLVPH